MDPKRILIVCRHAPYGNSLAREALDAALATAVFEQQLALLFLGDGVWQLNAGQDSDPIKNNNHGTKLSSLPLYEVTDLYAEEQALSRRQLQPEDLLLPVKTLSTDAIGSFINDFDTVLSF